MRNLPAIAIFVGCAAFTACNRAAEPAQKSNEPVRQYSMRGSVIRLDSQDRIATIKNEKIEGWMEAMTMDFPVKDPADFAKLHPGETVRATLFVQGLEYWVGNVRTDNAAAPGSDSR